MAVISTNQHPRLSAGQRTPLQKAGLVPRAERAHTASGSLAWMRMQLRDHGCVPGLSVSLVSPSSTPESGTPAGGCERAAAFAWDSLCLCAPSLDMPPAQRGDV